MLNLSLVLFTVFCGSIVLSTPVPSETTTNSSALANSTTDDEDCKWIIDMKRHPSQVDYADRGIKLFCYGKLTESAKSALDCGANLETAKEAGIACRSTLGWIPVAASCNDWGKFYKCLVNNLGSKCGGGDAVKYIGWSSEKPFVVEKDLQPVHLERCRNEIARELRSLTA